MSNIDEKGKNNFTIEMRIFENYEKVKNEIIKVIGYGVLRFRSIMFSFMK